MIKPRFSASWLDQYRDPFAVLGLSVVADDQRALKRYRHIAKLLHPDGLLSANADEKAIATQFLARLVNPAYRNIKQHKGRAERLAILRFQVRQQMDTLHPKTDWGRKLLKTPIANVEAIYEQAVTELSERQYSPFAEFEYVTPTLGELNLIYLRLKMGEPIIREKRVGVMVPPKNEKIKIPTIPVDRDAKVITYAQRHYVRAEEYLKKGITQLAITELKDAIKLEADQSHYHALLAKAYLMQKLPGAAKAYCRQALKLDPTNILAIQCAKTLKLEIPMMTVPTPAELKGRDRRRSSVRNRQQTKSSQKQASGLFGLFARKS